MPAGNESKGPLLRLERISKLYPGTIALYNSCLDLLPGEVHGVIGKNGAGKSTLVKIISGIIPPTSGLISLHGREHKALTPMEARQYSIGIVTQEPQIIPDFSVAENLFTPAYPRKRFKTINWSQINARATEILRQTDIDISARAKGSDLSISEQQLLLVMKAFYVDDAQIIILDEVTASLSEKDERLLYGMISRQREKQKAIIYITHRMAEIVKICDRVTVLRDGQSIVTEKVSRLTESELSQLITGQRSPAVFQEAPESRAGAAATTTETVLLGVQRLTKTGSYYDISFILRRNEIVGLAGLRGSGRTEILKTVSGILHPDAGKLILAGKTRKISSPADALKQGIAYLPEDRDREGLIEKLSVRFNLSLSSIASLRKGLFLDRKMELSRTQELVDLLAIETPSTEEEVLYLSGGNKQKVVVGRIISRKPKIFLLDEPTKGIDIGTKAGILEMVRTKLRQNAGVLLTSPGLEDLIAVCDRIIVLHEGRMVSEFLKRDFDESKIYLAMQGMRLQPPIEER